MQIAVNKFFSKKKQTLSEGLMPKRHFFLYNSSKKASVLDFDDIYITIERGPNNK